MNEDAKNKILARRAKFVAAAFVSITGCSSETTPFANPEPCLSQVLEDTGRVDTRPADSATDTSVTDSSDAADASDASDTSATDTGPMPCLVPPLDSGS